VSVTSSLAPASCCDARAARRRGARPLQLRRLATVIASIAMLLVGSASAQSPPLAVPQLEQCQADSHPRLPERWHATYLLAPFTNGQLVIADIVNDGSLSATRARLYGVRHGSLDLAVIGSHTYALSSRDGDTVCEDLGDTGWRPLPRDWLTTGSQCVGSAPLGDIATDWWKTPVDPAPSTYWLWSKTSDRTPFRLAFGSPSERLGVLSEFALAYQVRFEPSPDSQLAEVAAACGRTARALAPNAAQGLRDRIAAMARAPARADEQIELLMPELAACPATPLPRWTDRLAMTGMMTPWDADKTPSGTEVLYDWSARAQRTRLFPREAGRPMREALLLGGHGFNVADSRASGPVCTAVLPGTIRPDWASRGHCSCEAMITRKTPLTPYGATRIFTCPLASPRAAWAWYAMDGRPISFAVTALPGDQGSALFAVLDYRDWLPDHAIPHSAFDPPAQCPANVPARAASAKCSTCHLGNTR
jgi:hypothetical protein